MEILNFSSVIFWFSEVHLKSYMYFSKSNIFFMCFWENTTHNQMQFLTKIIDLTKKLICAKWRSWKMAVQKYLWNFYSGNNLTSYRSFTFYILFFNCQKNQQIKFKVFSHEKNVWNFLNRKIIFFIFDFQKFRWHFWTTIFYIKHDFFFDQKNWAKFDIVKFHNHVVRKNVSYWRAIYLKNQKKLSIFYVFLRKYYS